MVRYLKGKDDHMPAPARHALDMIDKYHGEVVPMYPRKRRRKAIKDHVKVMRDIPAKYGPWYIKRCKVTIDKSLMESEAERRALNQAMAKAFVPFYLYKAREVTQGRGRIYVMYCLWHHDGQFFRHTVSEGSEVIATSTLRE